MVTHPRSCSPYRIGVVGARGIVGQTVLEYLQGGLIPWGDVVAISTKDAYGAAVGFGNKELPLLDINRIDFSTLDIVFFCTNEQVSRKYVPAATQAGCVVIDKSSAYRLTRHVPLIVPEVNGDRLAMGAKKGIIATPNCVATPLVCTLKPLLALSAIKRVVVSTYQSASGAGRDAMRALTQQVELSLRGEVNNPAPFPKPLAFNLIPAIGSLAANGFSDEEEKIAQESLKILQEDVPIVATCVRVPTMIGHALAVTVEMEQAVTLADVRHAFKNSEALLLVDRPQDHVYATPLEARGKDAIFISRLRQDPTVPSGFVYWIVADNIRKGAALNGVQIAARMIAIDPTLDLFREKGHHER